jgi:hypothetical protein
MWGGSSLREGREDKALQRLIKAKRSLLVKYKKITTRVYY